MKLSFLQEPTKVVACGHCLSDVDGCSSHRDDEHLVVALNDEDTRFLRGSACVLIKAVKVQRTSLQVLQGEAVVDTVAGLSAPPTLQAGVFLLRRLQHVVTAQTLQREDKFHVTFTFISRVLGASFGCCDGKYGSNVHITLQIYHQTGSWWVRFDITLKSTFNKGVKSCSYHKIDILNPV